MGFWLVVWNIFSHILGIIIPTDELIFFRGVETTNQIVHDRGNHVSIFHDQFILVLSRHKTRGWLKHQISRHGMLKSVFAPKHLSNTFKYDQIFVSVTVHPATLP